MDEVTVNNPRVAALLREAVRLTYKVIGKHQAQFHRLPWSEESKLGEFITQIRRLSESKSQFPLSIEEYTFVRKLVDTTKWSKIGALRNAVGPTQEIEDIMVTIGELANLADQMDTVVFKGDSLLERIAKLQEVA